MAVLTPSQFVGYIMSHSVPLVAYVSTRIFFGNIPETVTTKPVINYMIVGKPRLSVHGIYRTHFQINVRDTNPEQIWTIANLIINLFDEYQDVADGYSVQCGYFDDARMMAEPNNYIVPIDIYITK